MSSNTSNTTNQSLCQDTISPTDVTCNCSLVEEYNCCQDIQNIVLCPYATKQDQFLGYSVFYWMHLGFAVVTLLQAFRTAFNLYAERKIEASKKKRKGKKKKIGVKEEATLVAIVAMTIDFLWGLSPHMGFNPIFGMGIYPNVVKATFLRLPQYGLVIMVFLFVLYWRNTVDVALNPFQNVSAQAREKARLAQQRNALILLLFLLALAVPFVFLAGIVVPYAIAALINSAIIAFTVLLIGGIGAPYYAYKVNKIVGAYFKDKPNSKDSDTLKNISKCSVGLGILSWGTILNYVFCTIQGENFGAKMQLLVVTHCAYCLGVFVMVAFIDPQSLIFKVRKSSKESSNKVTATESEMSTEVKSP